MQKLDRLGWASGIAFRAFGLDIGIRLNVPETPDDVIACLPPGWQRLKSPIVKFLYSLKVGGEGPRPGVRHYHLLYAGLRQAARTMDRDVLLWHLEDEIETLIAMVSRERIFVHAGVVAWKGRAVVLPGRSHAGKSTLVAELLKAGATYFSDEYALFDANGFVHPYARRLAIRRNGATDRVPAESLGAPIGHAPVPVAMVVRTEYRQGANWRPKRVSPAMALMELASYTLPEVTHSPEGQAALSQVALTTPMFKGPRGEADVTAREILRALESPF
jgi:hypothetical protein